MRGAVFAVFFFALGCPAETVDVVIIHTGAVRGHVFSLRYREHSAHYGGLFRCSTIIRDLRNKYPAALLIDGGGLIHGSAESDLSAGQFPLSTVGHMGYNARVLLPDELSGGLDAFKARQKSSRIPLVAANLEVSPRAGPAQVQHERYSTWVVDGVRIVFTAVILGNDRVAAPDEEAVIRIMSPRKSLNNVLREVRTLDADILLLALYSTLRSENADRITRLIAAQPEFDAVLVGAGERIEWNRSTWPNVSNLYRDGLEVGMVRFLYDKEKRRVLKTGVEYHRAGNEVQEDQALRQLVGPESGRIEHRLFSVLGYSNRWLGGTSSHEGQSGIQALISAAIRERFPCDVILVAQGVGGYLGKGAILSRDIFRAIPDLRTLAGFSLTAAELRAVLAESAGREGSSPLLGIDGAHYTLVMQPGSNPSVQDLTIGGRKPHGRARVRVLLQASLLEPDRGFQSLRALWSQPEVRAEILEVDTRKLVTEYVTRHSPLDIKAYSGVDIVERESAGDP